MNMKNIYKGCISVLFLLLSACSSEEKTNAIDYVFSKDNVLKLTDIKWERCKDVELQTSDSVVLAAYYRVQTNGNEFYVFSQGPIYRFDDNGKFLNKFGGIGHAENEYLELTDIYVNSAAKEIEAATPRMLKVYDFEGKYKFSKKLAIDMVSFFHDTDGYWFSTGANKQYSDCEVFKADDNFNVQKEFVNRGFSMPNLAPNFGNCPVKTYKFPLSNDVYHIDAENDTVMLAYRLRFPGLDIPEVFNYGKMGEVNFLDYDYVETWSFLESEQYIYVLVAENVDSKCCVYHWFIDKHSNKELVVRIGDAEKNFDSYLLHPQFLDGNNILYFFGEDLECGKKESLHLIGIDLEKLLCQ